MKKIDQKWTPEGAPVGGRREWKPGEREAAIKRLDQCLEKVRPFIAAPPAKKAR